MRFLLDTHILLALVNGPRASGLRPEINALLEDDGTDSFVSVASLWEIAIKVRLGKLAIPSSLANFPDLVRSLTLTVLPITTSHALAEVEPELVTRDPFDRLLLGVCQVEGLRLITADRAIVSHPLALKI